MQEIKCPHCGKVFQVDESGYAQILQQVRDHVLEEELNKREEEMRRAKAQDLEIARMEQEILKNGARDNATMIVLMV